MKTVIRTTAVLVLVAALLIGCRPQEAEKLPDEVTVQLKWIHQAQFAGMYAADEEGFYAEENMDVTLKPGGPDIPPEQMIADTVGGEADLAIVGGDRLLAARARGDPIVAIASVFQRNPYVYVTLKSSGIERPQDLVGKKVMVPTDAEFQHQALLRRLGIDPAAIEEIPYERAVTPLLTGQVDAHTVYRTGLGLAYEETGHELNWIWVEDYGIHFYVDTIVASEALVEQNPDLVGRFLRATLKGWRYAIENPDEAVDLTLQYDPALGRDRQARMMAAQTPLIHTGEVNIGWMRAEVWGEMHDILLEQGILYEPVDLDKVYTMEFLQKAYGGE